jgi:hypothetical protein
MLPAPLKPAEANGRCGRVSAEEPLLMNSDRPAVIDPQDAGYVLPAPPRTRREVVVVPEPERPSSLLQRTAASRALGERFHLQAECLQQCLREVRERLAQLDVAIAEDSRAQLKGAVREIDSVVDWCDAIQDHMVSPSAMRCLRAASTCCSSSEARCAAVSKASTRSWAHVPRRCRSGSLVRVRMRRTSSVEWATRIWWSGERN